MSDQEEPIEAEVVEEEESTAVALRPDYVPVDIEQSVAEWKAYQTLVGRLLTDDDYQRIGQKNFKKKSAWRKLGKAFNISCEVRTEEIVRHEDGSGWPVFARVIVRAIAQNGTFQESDQECHISEKCCSNATGGGCEKRHKHCMNGCDGRIHYAHPGDLVAIALTRAKNRAISDIIGAGEVSAEEMDGDQPSPKVRRPAATKATTAPDNNGLGRLRHQAGKAYDDHADTAGVEDAISLVQGINPDAIADGNLKLVELSEDQCKELIDKASAVPAT